VFAFLPGDWAGENLTDWVENGIRIELFLTSICIWESKSLALFQTLFQRRKINPAKRPGTWEMLQSRHFDRDRI
jgi:hypothetical protein